VCFRFSNQFSLFSLGFLEGLNLGLTMVKNVFYVLEPIFNLVTLVNEISCPQKNHGFKLVFFLYVGSIEQ
jgi:hypothetical protein